MGGRTEISWEQDICSFLLSRYCKGHLRLPSKCLFFGRKARVCKPCLYLISKGEFPEYDWGEKMCKCPCHDTGDCLGERIICYRCGNLTAIDVIYMTRMQVERG